MTGETASIIAGAVAAVAGAINTVVTQRGTRRSIEATNRVEVNTTPTSNGFAANTQRMLGELLAGQNRVEQRLDEHIDNHNR